MNMKLKGSNESKNLRCDIMVAVKGYWRKIKGGKRVRVGPYNRKRGKARRKVTHRRKR